MIVKFLYCQFTLSWFADLIKINLQREANLEISLQVTEAGLNMATESDFEDIEIGIDMVR